jgi:hypothetical protein
MEFKEHTKGVKFGIFSRVTSLSRNHSSLKRPHELGGLLTQIKTCAI